MGREREKNNKNRVMLILVAAVSVVAVFFTTVFCGAAVFAADSATEQHVSGTISIQLTDGKEGTTKNGIRFYCEMVGSVSEGEYVLNPQYRESGVDLNKLETSVALREAAEKLAGYKKENAKSDVTDQNGWLEFPDLEVGVYLIQAEDTSKYDAIEPALIIIPTWSESEEKMLYDINIVPKHTPKKDTPKTGVTDNIEPYLASVIGSLIVVGMVVKTRRKRNQNSR